MASDVRDDGALIRELASLARLELDDEQLDELGSQLDTILGYVRRLHAVDVADAPDFGPTDQSNSALREDAPAEVADFDREQALAGAPLLRDRSIAVPRFKG